MFPIKVNKQFTDTEYDGSWDNPTDLVTFTIEHQIIECELDDVICELRLTKTTREKTEYENGQKYKSSSNVEGFEFQFFVGINAAEITQRHSFKYVDHEHLTGEQQVYFQFFNHLRELCALETFCENIPFQLYKLVSSFRLDRDLKAIFEKVDRDYFYHSTFVIQNAF